MSAPEYFKSLWTKYHRGTIVQRKRLVGNVYLATLKSVRQKAEENRSWMQQLKLRTKTTTNKDAISKYTELIKNVGKKVQDGVDLCSSLWVESPEIEFFADMFGLRITVHFANYTVEKGPERGAKIFLMLKNAHYTPSKKNIGVGIKFERRNRRPPTSTPKSNTSNVENSKEGNRIANPAKSNTSNAKMSRRSSAKTSHKSNGSNVSASNNGSENRQPTQNYVGSGEFRISGSNEGNLNVNNNLSRGSLNLAFKNSNLNDFNVNTIANTLFERVNGGVPNNILDAASKYGLGSDGFEPLFKQYVRSKPYGKGCDVKLLSRAQVDVYERAKVIAELSTKNNSYTHRGLLIHANTGSGKTIMTLSIFLAYWKTGRTMYVITTKDNIDQNNPAAYMANLRTFFPEHHRVLLDKYGSDREIEKEVFLKVTGSQVQRMKKINFISLEIFAHKLGYEGRGFKDNILNRKEEAVVVFDESHNLFQTLTGRLSKGAPLFILDKLIKMNKDQRRNIHLFLASATPTATTSSQVEPVKEFENWFKTFAIVAPVADRYFEDGGPYTTLRNIFSRNKQDPFEFIKRYIRPLMVYIDQRFDTTKHACVDDTRIFVKCTKWYYGALVATKGDSIKSMSNAMGVDLKAANKVLTKQVIEIFKKKKMIVPIMSRTIVHDWLVSPKTAAIARFVATKRGKHYIYVADKTQAFVLMHTMRHVFGFRIMNASKNENNNELKRYYLNSVSNEKTGKMAPGVMLLDSGKMVQAVKRVFDRPDNDRGDQCRAIIATGGMYEGVDFETVRYVHMATPVENALQEQQLSGRGVRLCAHERLKPEKRRVTVIRWFLEPPKDDSLRSMLKYLQRSGKKKRETVEALASLLGRVVKQMKSCASKGPEYFVREVYLANERALAVWNFERTIQAVLKGRKKAPNSKRIIVVGGKQCKK